MASSPLLSLVEAGAATERLYVRLQQRRPDAEKAMAYFRGEQGALMFATDDFREAASHRYDSFSDNWCQPVVMAAAERTTWQGIKLPGSDRATQSPDEKRLWSALQASRINAQMAQAFTQAPVQRRAFLSVWAHRVGPLAGEPLVAVESATQAIVEYDPEVRWWRRFGLKVYCDDTWEYATLSTPEWVYPLKRPISAGIGGVQPSGLIIAGVGGRQWQANGEPISNHLGRVPLVELPYRPMLDGEPLSDISGVMAMQDAINLLWAYLFNSADYASLPARVVMGQQPPKVPVLDENGQKVGERPVDSKELTKGRILWLTGQTASIGKWDAAQLEPFTNVIEQLVGHVAAQSRTPPYYLMSKQGMSNLAESAVKAADTGLVMKVQQAIDHYEDPLRDVLELVALQLGDAKLAEQAVRAEIRWKDKENRSEAQKADAFQKNLLAGYPFEYLLIQDGKSPEEIDLIMSLREKERAEAAAQGLPVQPLKASDITPLAGSEAPQAGPDGVVAPSG